MTSIDQFRSHANSRAGKEGDREDASKEKNRHRVRRGRGILSKTIKIAAG